MNQTLKDFYQKSRLVLAKQGFCLPNHILSASIEYRIRGDQEDVIYMISYLPKDKALAGDLLRVESCHQNEALEMLSIEVNKRIGKYPNYHYKAQIIE
ncbi:MAG: hypothetical protein RIR12_1677 [Bacteroidota bacterium]|jgi:hypothetical protein